MTVHLDVTASRNETWRPTIDLPYRGNALPLAGASVEMQWRLYEGAPGAALVDMPNVPFADLSARDEDEDAPADLRILRLTPIIPQSVLDGLPTGLNQPEPGEADRYVWDAIITYADGPTDRPVEGFVYLNKGTVHA